MSHELTRIGLSVQYHYMLSLTLYSLVLCQLLVLCNGLTLHDISNITNVAGSNYDTCCQITTLTEHAKSLSCNNHVSCTFSFRPGVKLTLVDITETSVSGTDYLYFENTGSSHNFISFFGDFPSFRFSTKSTEVTLQVRAKATIKLSDIFDASPNNTQRLSPDKLSDRLISEFNRVIKCEPQVKTMWKFASCNNTCGANCECRLSQRALHAKCPSTDIDGNTVETLDDALVIVPSNFNVLDLKGNNLSIIDDGVLGTYFQGKESVIWLYLNENNLQTIQRGIFTGLTQLGHLDISENSLQEINPGTFLDLYNLEELFIDYNNLTILRNGVFNGLVRLETLHIHGNQIRSIDSNVFRDVPQLVWLSLSNNKLTAFDSLSGLTFLQSLALQSNQLKRISDDIFESLPNLTTLNVSFNRLNVLPTLQRLPHLQLLDIRKNPLKRVDHYSFSGLNSFTDVLVDEQGTCCFVSHSNCNATNPKPPYLTCKRMLPHMILRAFMWILGWMALFGNAFVLLWRCIGKMEEDKVQSLLITNLALSDMLMGIYMLILVFADMHFGLYFPSHAKQWRSGGTCKLAGVLSLASCEASVFFVTLISVDRYIRVVYPHTIHRLRYETTRTTSIILWLLALALAIIPISFVGRNDKVYDISEVCIGLPLVRKSIYKIEETKYQPAEWFVYDLKRNITTESGSTSGMYFSNAIFLGLNLLCFCVVLFCYLSILKAVRDTHKRVNLSGNRDREIKMAAKMFMIVGTDFLCWVPIIITGVLVQCELITISPVMFAWAVTFVLPINSSVNPYLYTIPTMISKYYGCRNPICHVSSSSEVVRIPGVQSDNTQVTKVTSSRVMSNSKQHRGSIEMDQIKSL